MIKSLVQATIVLAVGVLLGMSFYPGISVFDFIGAYAALFLMAFGLSFLFMVIAIRVSSWQSQMAVMNLLNLPLLFNSNAFYPIKSMPFWLKPIAEVNPLTYSNAVVKAYATEYTDKSSNRLHLPRCVFGSPIRNRYSPIMEISQFLRQSLGFSFLFFIIHRVC